MPDKTDRTEKKPELNAEGLFQRREHGDEKRSRQKIIRSMQHHADYKARNRKPKPTLTGITIAEEELRDALLGDEIEAENTIVALTGFGRFEKKQLPSNYSKQNDLVSKETGYNPSTPSPQAAASPPLRMREPQKISDDALALLTGSVPESLRPRLYTKRDVPPPPEAVSEANRIMNTYVKRKKEGRQFNEAEMEIVRRAGRVQSAAAKHRKIAKLAELTK